MPSFDSFQVSETGDVSNNQPVVDSERMTPEDTCAPGDKEGSRCIYIDSVDSGRSSDTGTHQSWTSSSGSSTKSSTKSASDSGASAGASSGAGTSGGPANPNNVQIVPHTFCDYLGSIKRRISPSSTG